MPCCVGLAATFLGQQERGVMKNQDLRCELGIEKKTINGQCCEEPQILLTNLTDKGISIKYKSHPAEFAVLVFKNDCDQVVFEDNFDYYSIKSIDGVDFVMQPGETATISVPSIFCFLKTKPRDGRYRVHCRFTYQDKITTSEAITLTIPKE
jgi:hypothetical protein